MWRCGGVLGAAGSPKVCTAGQGRSARSTPRSEAPAAEIQRGAGEPMARSGWDARRAAPLPAPPCPQGGRQRGRSPASPTAWQRGKGSQRGTHSRSGCPRATTLGGAGHTPLCRAIGAGRGACAASGGAVSPCPAAQQHKGRRGIPAVTTP